jgi:hypothetical protein
MILVVGMMIDKTKLTDKRRDSHKRRKPWTLDVSTLFAKTGEESTKQISVTQES